MGIKILSVSFNFAVGFRSGNPTHKYELFEGVRGSVEEGLNYVMLLISIALKNILIISTLA